MTMCSHPFLHIVLGLGGLILMSCSHKQIPSTTQQKIRFDYSRLDQQGLRNGGSAVDYEYCIPADEDAFQKIHQIDPDVRLMKSSKGRSGCTEDQWLCVSSTYGQGWKDRLMAIASLDMVERIIETYWE